MDVCDSSSCVKIIIEHVKLWKCIVRSIKSVLDGGNLALRVHKAGFVSVKTTDVAHVALLLFKMRCEIEGLGRDAGDDVTLVLSSANLEAKLGMVREQNELSLVYFPDAPIDKNIFLFEEESQGCAVFNRYRLNLLTDDYEEPALPPRENFVFEILLEMSLLRGLLSNADKLLKGDTNTISFIVSQSKTSPTSEVVNRLQIVLGLGTEDEFGTSVTTLHENALDAKRIELDGPAMRGAQPVAEAPFADAFDESYSVKQLLDFLGALEPQTISIGLSKAMPLKLTYPLDETGESTIMFYAAPRVRADDV